MVRRMPRMLPWIWLNLLVEDIENQRMPEYVLEDRINKPWRLLPSNRLTPKEAQIWLFTAIIVAVGVSVMVGGFTPSVSLLVLVWMYNNLDDSRYNIWLRNGLNAAGLMCFNWGALSVLSSGDLLPRVKAWILITGAINVTTIHAQDLPDMDGDQARQRQTIPLLHGQGVTRQSLAGMGLFWFIACPISWGYHYGATAG
ncbi:hypothetical protein QQS21_004787 [Conoideocrella luteorostrata]|uniref:Uncharacterized protein n=1 Tax=Conoideocrella luteorostrata TaxID=1105319 RepID=A0AAJ0G1C5_9HYPO|nr:hypothetical protein QQS21_004787 [Conoideocrella luteorostrata]